VNALNHSIAKSRFPGAYDAHKSHFRRVFEPQQFIRLPYLEYWVQVAFKPASSRVSGWNWLFARSLIGDEPDHEL
jgi:hypothetical protein